ncbi:hypothetical protein FVE85_5511 [Porphyridium purpureum]|uniref:Uncharacterized protein n=1 Tax=Porphyridium purpureum TaxID=35688 RepID=A0A5J4Z2R8_PORPP|nr:hypothetical protein FVE85_5511 [Porphyridium purpureum]|eukprot:POR8391..scf295_1
MNESMDEFLNQESGAVSRVETLPKEGSGGAAVATAGDSADAKMVVAAGEKPPSNIVAKYPSAPDGPADPPTPELAAGAAVVQFESADGAKPGDGRTDSSLKGQGRTKSKLKMKLPRTSSMSERQDSMSKPGSKWNILMTRSETMNELEGNRSRSSGSTGRRTASSRSVSSRKKMPRNPRSIIEMRREPALHFAPYGTFWFVDPLALGHNAVRRELLDCYIILYCMDVRRLELSSRDIDMFFVWWSVFESFFKTYLDAEEMVLFPWVESAIELTGLLERTRRTQIVNHLKTILDLMSKAKPKLVEMVEEGEPVFLMKRAVDKISLLTQEYFVAQERVIPRLIQKAFKPADKRAYDKRFMNFLFKSQQAAYNVVLVSRWLQPDVKDPKKLLEWRYDNLGKVNWARYSVWYKQLEAKHIKILADFRAKRNGYLEEEKQKKILYKTDPQAFLKKYGTLEDPSQTVSETSSYIDLSSQSAKSPRQETTEEDAIVDEAAATAAAAATAEEGEKKDEEAEQAEKAEAGAGENAPEASGEGEVDESAEKKEEETASAVDRTASTEDKLDDSRVGPEVDMKLAEYERRMSAGLEMDYDLLSLKTDEYADSVVLDDQLSLQEGGASDKNLMNGVHGSPGPSKPATMVKTGSFGLPLELAKVLGTSQKNQAYDLEDFLDFDDTLSISGREGKGDARRTSESSYGMTGTRRDSNESGSTEISDFSEYW